MLMNLRKIGITQNISDLTVFKAEVFNIIAQEISKLESEEMKKSSKR